ncbi:hypothetical protein QA600_03995 [Natronococcus sp. A-GB1]|uniref:hypothetical protein n=1 Tax=Natronococcus sp. A-GB1 TaxID=3037648 RepID=UPI00241F8DEA|nr:hypothetical protein [Natronococcus sp. A-GB1]MDG5758498.1 hypothetical protein [Natronococcus sp. A-GB1]
MTPSTTEQESDISDEVIELPATETVQRALHEATAHLYDELAVAKAERTEEAAELPPAVFDDLEELYVATAEESVTTVRISYEQE